MRSIGMQMFGLASFFSIAAIHCASSSEALPVTPDSDSGATESDALVDSGSPPFPAIHPPIPLLTSRGGAVIRSPKVFTVTFGADPFEKQLQDFDDEIVSTPWWKTVTSEYCSPGPTDCIGKGAGVGHAVLPIPASTKLTDGEMRQLIQTHVTDGSFPAPTEETIYMFYLPSSITVTTPEPSTSCIDFHAFHNYTTITPASGAAVKTTYGIVARCPDGASFDSMTELGSHELAEAATDPFLDGFTITEAGWSATHGGEICDVCLYGGATNEGTWAVELGFSNAAAAKGLNPCLPKVGDVDFNVAPADGKALVRLQPGKSGSIDLVAYSEAELEPWGLTIVQSGGRPGLATFTIDHSLVKNGDPVKLIVTLSSSVTKDDPYVPFMIRSKSAAGDARFWPGVVLIKP